MSRKDLIETPYGRKTPELLCRAMDALVVQEAVFELLQQAEGVLSDHPESKVGNSKVHYAMHKVRAAILEISP